MRVLGALAAERGRKWSIKRNSASARLCRAICSVEGLESRTLFAVTASLTAGSLTVTLGAASDTATLTGTSAAGRDIQLAGTGFTTASFSGVSAIHILDGGSNAGQSVALTSSGTDQINLTGGISIAGIETVTVSTSTSLQAASFAETGASAGVQINTAGITTNGTMSFADTVTLGTDTTLDTTGGGTTTGGAALTLATVNGAAHNLSLTAGTGGALSFGGAVTNVASLTANAGSVNVGGAITASTSGSVSLTATSGILVGAGVSTANGNLTLSANQQATATSGNFIGVDIEGAAVQSTGSGAVNVDGRGGEDASGQQIGVSVIGTGAKITSGGGSVTVTGQGGGSGTGGQNYGVDLESGGTITAGGSGTVTLTGTGGANDTVGSDIGVILTGSGAQITSAGGNVLVTGHGGGSVSANFDYGVAVADGDTITAGGTGSVTVMGSGGLTSGGSDAGVVVAGVSAAATITSAGGNVSVTGQGGGSGASGTNVGVAVEAMGTITSGGTGTVTVSGTGGAASGAQNYGVWLVVAGAQVTSAGGDVAVTGVAGGGSGSSDVEIDASTTLSSGGTGNLTINANSLNLASTAAIQGGSTGHGIVTIDPRTTGTNIDLGGASAPGTLGLSSVELGQISAGTLRIGAVSDTGNIAITAAVSWPGILHLLTGGSVGQTTSAPLDVTSLAITAAGVIRLTNSVNNVTNLAVDMTGAGNFLALNDGPNALTIVSGQLDGVLGITTNDAPITFQADSMNIDAPVNVGTSSVSLNPFTFERPIVLGSKPAGALGFTNAELANITAHILRIGDLDTQSALAPTITITAPIVAPSTWTTLELFSESGPILQNSGASITVPNLAATGGGGVFLTDPGNTVTNLGGAIGGGSALSFNFVNSTSFNVANVDAGADADGIESEGSAINLTALGNGSLLSVNAPISSPQGFGSFIPTVTLSADQMALSALVSAGNSGVLTLEQGSATTRGIDLGGGTAAGDLDLSDAELGKAIASVLRIGRIDNLGDITITAPFTTHPDYQTLSLLGGGSIDDLAAGDTIAASNLAVRAATGIDLDTVVANVAFHNASSGNVRITNTGAMTLTNVDALNGTTGNEIGNFASGGTTNLTASGPITFAINTTSRAGLTVATTESASEVSRPLSPPDDDITVNAGVTVIGGNVSFQAADAIVVNATGQISGRSVTLSCGVGDNDSDGSMTLNGGVFSGNNIFLNIPSGDTGSLTAAMSGNVVTLSGGGSFFVDGTGSIMAGVAVTAGTLGGTGEIDGEISVSSGATLAAGHSAPGVLTVGGDGTLSSGSSFAVQLGGATPGTGAGHYSQLVVVGNLALNGATLSALLTFVPTAAQTFTLVQATGIITGQFAQGSTITLNGITYEILYSAHSVVLSQEADLSVGIAGLTSANEGSTDSYTYTVSNSGPDAAQNVVLSAPFPSGAVLLSASFGGAFIALPPSAYNPSSGMVNIGALPSGAAGTLTLTVLLPEENPGVTFTASVASSTLDINPSNNVALLTTQVNDAPLTGHSRTVSPTQGSKIFSNVTVATFSDANLLATTSDFTATVNWGDGTTSAAQIVSNGDGTFSVVASHTYNDAKLKSSSLLIQIVDAGGSTAAVTSTATLHP